MADDVTQFLEKMKLTVEEEETITISDEGRKEEIESCELNLIGKFLACRSLIKEQLWGHSKKQGDWKMECKSLK